MNKADRINNELKAVGVSAYGRWKHPARQLVTLLRDDEHVEAAAYGQSEQGSAMLVATNKRVLFVEGNFMYNSSDDFGYDVISGVHSQATALFKAVTLYTKLQTYHLTYVNSTSAERFVKLIEDRVAHVGEVAQDIDLRYEAEEGEVIEEEPLPERQYAVFSDEARAFLEKQETMVVSTASRTGQVHAAVVYYALVNDVFYMLTKKDTQKSHNLIAGRTAALTIYNAETKQTAQIQAETDIIGDPQLSQKVFTLITSVMHGGVSNLPVAQLDAGGYIIFSLRPIDVKYRDYGKNRT